MFTSSLPGGMLPFPSPPGVALGVGVGLGVNGGVAVGDDVGLGVTVGVGLEVGVGVGVGDPATPETSTEGGLCSPLVL